MGWGGWLPFYLPPGAAALRVLPAAQLERVFDLYPPAALASEGSLLSVHHGGRDELKISI